MDYQIVLDCLTEYVEDNKLSPLFLYRLDKYNHSVFENFPLPWWDKKAKKKFYKVPHIIDYTHDIHCLLSCLILGRKRSRNNKLLKSYNRQCCIRHLINIMNKGGTHKVIKKIKSQHCDTTYKIINSIYDKYGQLIYDNGLKTIYQYYVC